MAGERWIAKAIKRPGALTAMAKRAGQTTKQFARAHAKAKGTVGKMARLAITLAKLPRPSKAARSRGGRKAAATRKRSRK